MLDNLPPPVFRIKDLGHRYGQTTALVDLTAEIAAGETVAILGPSGCGKSTLLSLLGLLWDKDGPTGSAWFHDGRNEHELLRLSTDDKAALRAAAFGFVLQSSYLLPHFTCIQNLAVPLALQGWPAEARERWAAALLDVEGIDPRGDLRQKKDIVPRRTSLGQRQRFGILRALIADPMVVFADEPSSNLDPGSTRAMFDLLAQWKGGTLFSKLRTDFAADPATPAPVRRWFDETARNRPRRTLILVCHDVQTARRTSSRFLVLNQKHQLEADFVRAQWDQNAQTLETVLGLPAGSAGRDAP